MAIDLLHPVKPTRFPESAFFGLSLEQVCERLEYRDIFEDGRSYGVQAIADRLGLSPDAIRRAFLERMPDRNWAFPGVRGRTDGHGTAYGRDVLAWLERTAATHTITAYAARVLLQEHPELTRPPIDQCDLATRLERQRAEIEKQAEAETFARQAEETTRKWDQLAELLSRFDCPKADDVERLAGLMPALALTDAGLRGLAGTRRKFVALESERAQAADRAAKARKKHDELRATFDAEHGDRLRALEQAKAKYERLQREFDSDFGGEWNQIRAAANAVREAEAQVDDPHRLKRAQGYAARASFQFAAEAGPDGWPALRYPA